MQQEIGLDSGVASPLSKGCHAADKLQGKTAEVISRKRYRDSWRQRAGLEDLRGHSVSLRLTTWCHHCQDQVGV